MRPSREIVCAIAFVLLALAVVLWFRSPVPVDLGASAPGATPHEAMPAQASTPAASPEAGHAEATPAVAPVAVPSPPVEERAPTGEPVEPEPSAAGPEVAAPLSDPFAIIAHVSRGADPVTGLVVEAFDERHLGPLHARTTDGEGDAFFPLPAPGAGYLLRVEVPGSLPALTFAGAPGRYWFMLGLSSFEASERFVDAEGRPLRVSFRVHYGASVVAEWDSADDGSLTWNDLGFPGLVEVRAPGYLPQYFDTQSVLDGEDTVLLPGDPGRLVGRVFDAHKRAAEGSAVRGISTGIPVLLAACGPDGKFDLGEVPPGLYALEVTTTRGLPPARRAEAIVTGGKTTEIDILLPAESGLRVRVLDGSGVVPEARVAILDPTVGGYEREAEASAAEQEARADARGEAYFRLPPGAYYVRAWEAHSARSGVAEAHVPEEGDSFVEVRLPRLRELRVKVVDSRRQPIPAVFADISVTGFQRRQMPAQVTNAQGEAVFQDLPEGKVEVHLARGGFWRLLETVLDRAEFVWTDPASFGVEGEVAAADSVAVLVACLDDVCLWQRTFPREGRIDDTVRLPNGPSSVWLVPLDRGRAPVLLGGPGEGTRGFRVAFPPAARVEGQLADARSGSGVVGTVRVLGHLGGVLEARRQQLGGYQDDDFATRNEWQVATGPGGSFVIEGLPPGVFTLALEAFGGAASTLEIELRPGEVKNLGAVTVSPR